MTPVARPEPRVARPLVVAASPHLKGRDSVPTIMWNVVGSLVPIIAAATWFFGPSALFVIGASALGALGTERVLGRSPSSPRSRWGSIADGSAAITGILLGLTLPAGMPLWMAFIGGAFAIGFGKLLFGGIGYNIFNPALLGRAFLMAAFPVATTTWPAAAGAGASWWSLRGDNFALPLLTARATDAITAATPLNLMKFEHKGTALLDLVLGTTGGSLGETAGLLILLCGAYLAWRGFLNWRIPASILATVAAVAALLHSIDAGRYPSASFMLFSGGIMLGAVYMATDPVTAPVTNAGRWVFGVGVGLLVVVIRIWGGLPEGVMYAILLMNALVPFLNRATQPRVFGTRVAREGAP
ncbi:MAG TPA: RnfABCDGE type electron transport complex subunit D [Gemmatimonadaceae bacterium]|nr:RnfABCDGE type electron transport complex subunit D [Gemmatimonadaceae bacterium]